MVTDRRTPSRPTTLVASRVRLYETVRTAHLERAHELAPAAIVFRSRRYDFDDSLIDGLELIQASRSGAARLIARSDVTVLEVNEPLMLNSLPTTILTILALAARRKRPRIVTYVIGNANPFATSAQSGFRRRARARLDLAMARAVWSRLDRVVFGTDAARLTYEAVLGAPRRAEIRDIPALPAREAHVAAGPTLERVVFLGAFVARKGLPQVITAWPRVRQRRPTSTLLLMGKGELLADVQHLVEREPSVTVMVDPSRAAIREELASSRVLVLPSQPTPTWREQIGLPILEGLEQGCRIVASTETGLAPWLAANGHAVVSVPTDVRELADAIAAQLELVDDRTAILDALPIRDGRLAADDWLFDS